MNENEWNVQTPAIEEPVVVKPKSKKGIWIGAAAALVVIAVIAAVVIGALTSSPLALLATGFRNSVGAMEDDAYATLMEQVSNGGSMEFSMDLATLLQESGLPLSGTGSLKIYMNEKEQKNAMTLGVQLGGQKLDASLFTDQESVVIASDWLLGDKAYGITLKNFAEDFNKSVFGPNGAYSLGIEIPENFQVQMDEYQNYVKDTEKIAAQLATQLMKTLEKNATIEKENATLTLGGETAKTTAVTVKMDSEQLASVVEDMLGYLRTDEAFRAYVEEYKELLFSNAVNGVVDADAKVDEVFKALDDAAEEMDALKKEIQEEEAGLDATFHITKSGKQLIGVELFFASNIEPAKVSVYAGPDLKNAKEIRFEVSSGDETIQGTYLVKVDDENTYMALLDLNENEEALVKADIRWDKQTGAWEFTVTDALDESIIVRGTQEYSDKEFSVVLESVEAEGEKVDLGLNMVLRASDIMPEMPQYTQLLTMTEDAVTSLVNDLSMVFFQLMYGMA